jgi:uncharacterized protein with NRDE domain
MCVVAIAWQAHPRWPLLVAGNRDEFHARASAPLARWNDGSGIIAGRDLVSGGTWMGVKDAGRFAVVTNIRNADGPDPAKLSRGALVTDWLADARLPDDPDRFNPFNLIAIGADGVTHLANRPSASRHPLAAGVHGLSNAIPNERWPRTERLTGAMAAWLERAGDEPEQLLDLLGDESIADRDAHPLFIRSPVYGTRCSTIVSVDRKGSGQIVERRFDADGNTTGQTSLHFLWSPQEA